MSIALPTLEGQEKADWHDLYTACGPEAVRDQLERAEKLNTETTESTEQNASGQQNHQEQGAAGDLGVHDGWDDGSGDGWDGGEGGGEGGGGNAGDAGSAGSGGSGGFGGQRQWISDNPVTQAEKILQTLFAPERPGAPYRLRWHGGEWWTRSKGSMSWRKVHELELLQQIRRRFRDHWLPGAASGKGRGPRPWAPKTDTVRDALLAALPLVGVPGGQMPCWLPGLTTTGDGQLSGDDFEAFLNDRAADGPIRRESVVAFEDCLLDADAWGRGQTRLLPVDGRWFTSSVLNSPFPRDLPPTPLFEVTDQPAHTRRSQPDQHPDLEHEPIELFGQRCPRWLQFIAELGNGSEQWIECLQRFMGLLLTPDTSLQRILWIQGPPGSGKGTLCSVISDMVGEGNAATTEFNTLGDRFELASLVGKMVSFMPELHVSRSKDVQAALSRLKSISGGDPQSIDRKFGQKDASVRLSVRFVITPNEEPSFQDASGALMRRLVVLPLTTTFTDQPDHGLRDTLRAEIPWIRIWALYGLRRLRHAVAMGQPPFPEPPTAGELRQDIYAAMSSVGAWVQQACVVGEGHACTREALFAWYSAWAKAEGLAEMSKPGFGKRLRAAVPQVGRTDKSSPDGLTRVKCYTGIRPLVPGETKTTALVRARVFDEMPHAHSMAGGYPSTPVWEADGF